MFNGLQVRDLALRRTADGPAGTEAEKSPQKLEFRFFRHHSFLTAG